MFPYPNLCQKGKPQWIIDMTKHFPQNFQKGTVSNEEYVSKIIQFVLSQF